MVFSAEFALAFSSACVRANMSFAGRQPNRRRGSEGYCCRSSTEQQRAVAGPCKMNFVVVFLCAEFAFPFSSPCVRANMSFEERQPSRRRGSEGDWCRSSTEQQLADAVSCKMNFAGCFLCAEFAFPFSSPCVRANMSFTARQ